MIKKTLYFGNPAYLSLQNKQLVVKLPEVEKNDTLPDSFKAESVKTIPVEDIGIVILDNKQITLTHGLIEVLLENNCALITCGSNRMPVGLMLPLEGNTVQSERFRYQIEASLPLKKQLWQQTIVAKIENQAAVLQELHQYETGNMLRWASKVRSGDPENIEARAAAYYWANLFPNHPEFTRKRDGVWPNALLNYGYAILRAIIARGLVGTGLLPTFGIHHHNRYNAYCLADDIMEPYRPFVDRLVYGLLASHPGEELTKELKTELLQIPFLDVKINQKRSPLMVAANTTTTSLYKCYSGESRKIVYPEFSIMDNE
ncbi:MAG: type II CRISPR-associated endonuclease Cas1 [Cytophagaceae bacterium]|jgi:CRISPR-associated protein Cas1|nr:type II CRISPR-associated endonuclease Cas1 [Cytophagaceae bacterium]